MSDYPTQQPGYTKTGKSLKAVRRYYALKNKRKRTPEDRDDESRRKERERATSVSKRKRSPDDDKLSKRIAAELKVQQDALEKRKDREPVTLNAVTDRSALPLIIQPRDFGGPTFVSEPANAQPNKSVSAKSAKSVKSTKSNKSAGEAARALLDPQTYTEQSRKLSIHSLGCVVICLVMSIIFITCWLVMLITKYGSKTSSPAKKKAIYSYLNVSWMAYSGMPAIFAVPYFLVFKDNFKHVLLALVLMAGGTFGATAFFIYILAFYAPLPLKVESTSEPIQDIYATQNPLIFWFSVSFLASHLLVLCLLIRQVMYTVSKQVDEKSVGKFPSDSHMSMYLAPK